jgi:hypothetical protein
VGADSRDDHRPVPRVQPQDEDGLRIDQEMGEIQQKVRLADDRDGLRLEYAVAAQPADLDRVDR